MKLEINGTTFLIKFSYTEHKVIKKGGKFPKRTSTCYIKTPVGEGLELVTEGSVSNHISDPFVRRLGRAYSFWAAVNSLVKSEKYGLTSEDLPEFIRVFDEQCPSSKGIVEEFLKV